MCIVVWILNEKRTGVSLCADNKDVVAEIKAAKSHAYSAQACAWADDDQKHRQGGADAC